MDFRSINPYATAYEDKQKVELQIHTMLFLQEHTNVMELTNRLGVEVLAIRLLHVIDIYEQLMDTDFFKYKYRDRSWYEHATWGDIFQNFLMDFKEEMIRFFTAKETKLLSVRYIQIMDSAYPLLAHHHVTTLPYDDIRRIVGMIIHDPLYSQYSDDEIVVMLGEIIIGDEKEIASHVLTNQSMETMIDLLAGTHVHKQMVPNQDTFLKLMVLKCSDYVRELSSDKLIYFPFRSSNENQITKEEILS